MADRVCREFCPEYSRHDPAVAPTYMNRSRVRLLRHRLTLAKKRTATLPQDTARPPGHSGDTSHDCAVHDPTVIEDATVSTESDIPANIFTPVYTNSDEGPILLRPSAAGCKLRAAPGELDAGGCSLRVPVHGCRNLIIFMLTLRIHQMVTCPLW